jgi:hypothetical protein
MTEEKRTKKEIDEFIIDALTRAKDWIERAEHFGLDIDVTTPLKNKLIEERKKIRGY